MHTCIGIQWNGGGEFERELNVWSLINFVMVVLEII